MNTLEFLTSLRKADITITVNGEGLHINAPSGAITESLKNEIKIRKNDIVKFLNKTNQSGETNMEPIAPTGRGQDCSLSPSQERVWLLAQVRPLDPSFNMYTAFNIEGALNIPVLAKSFQQIIDRHEILRTTFTTREGHPVQIISPDVTIPLTRVDLRNFDEKTQRVKIEQLANTEVRAPFNLTEGPLVRVKLLELTSHCHVLIVTLHHVISDGWSFSVFFTELTTFYEDALAHKKTLMPSLPIQYADFSIWHRGWLESEQCKAQIEFWRQELETPITPLVLPLDWSRPAQPTSEATVQTRKLSPIQVNGLTAFAVQHGISKNILFMTAFLVTLFTYSDQEDLVICSPVSGRNRTELQPLIGFFNNIVPLRVTLSKDLSLSELLKKVRIKTLEVFEHQDTPLHHIISETQVERVPLTRAMFDFQNQKMQPFRLPETTIKTLELHNGTSNCELTLTIFEKEEESNCTIEYKTSLFTDNTIQQLLANFEIVLETIIRTPEQKLLEIPSPITRLQQETYVELNEKHQTGDFNTRIKNLTSRKPTDSSNNSPDEESPDEVERCLVSQLPHNSVEAKMTKIWEELLGKGPIGRHENFFDLGGHSLLAVCLFSKIQTVFGDLLPLSTILHASTIEQLSRVVAKDKNLDLWNSLVPIQIRGSQPPIFAAHPISGHILTYADLSGILGPDQPFYGLQSLGLDGNRKPYTRVEDMAAHYIREIEEIQPEGPYFLVGGCMGGLVAYEMAQQFHSKGKEVAFLGMMDTWLPHSNPGSGNFNPDKFPNLGILWSGTKSYYKQLREVGLRKWIPHTAGKIQVFLDMVRRFDVHRGDQVQKGIALVLAANLRASETYQPKPFRGKVTYYLASARNNVGRVDPRLEWESFAREGVDICRIPAPNSGMLLARPYVAELAIHLKEVLQQVKEERT